MKHSRIKSLLGAYLDGELKGKVKSKIEEHLKTCSECKDELELLRILHSKIKDEEIPLPADSFWDYFPKRVMERLEEQKSASSFSLRVPRIKWELAGGLILILLTFIVSKQIIMEKSERIKPVARIPRIGGGEKIATKKGFYAKDEEKVAALPASSDKATIRIPEEKKTKMAVVEKGVIPQPEKRKWILKKTSPVLTVTKAPKLANEVERGVGGVSPPEGIMEEKQEIAAQEAISKSEKEIDILSDIKTKEDYLKTSRDLNEAKNVRRDLLKLYYIEAGKSKKKDDIKKALKEIEVYKDSFSREFKDTLMMLSDSLRIMLEEIEKKQ